jgi:hypothetical protein
VAILAMAASGAYGAWSENFDSYLNGSTILSQGAWVGWHQTGIEDTTVTDAQAASAPHSLVMGGPAVVDLVPQFSGATSGTWHLDVMTYVPGTSNSKSSDIGFLARHTGFQGAPNTQWFGPFTLNMETGMVNGALPIIRNQWVPMHTVFDLDARTYDIFYNGELAKSGSFPDAWDSAVVGLDPWTPAGASPLYYDDFRMASTIFVPREAPSLTITGIADDLVFTWDSRDGQKYNLRSETGLSTDPATWPVFDGNGNLGATPPENTLTISRPADAERFFVIEEFLAPPVPIFEEHFDTTPAGSLPTGWTLGGSPGDVPGTNWELGAPSIVGPPTAFDGLNCVGTNIAAPYTLNANIFLRSPMIDLVNATGATLNFAHWVDIEADFDFGSVAVLDATDNSELGLVVNVVDGDLPGDWTQFSRSVPAAALGKNVIFEFRFFEDGIGLLDQAGWYIDNVVVTVPGS